MSSSTGKFVHLHAHSDNSFLDGANRVKALVDRAAKFQMPALAVTDHGVMHGAMELYQEAKKANIRPIIGMEAYVAPRSRHDKDGKAGDDANYHLVILARDKQGYENLTKLTSLAFSEGMYRKPRIDRELLERYNEGLIVTSACLGGELAQGLMKTGEEGERAARETIEWYANVFKDRYYLEVQAHNHEGQSLHNGHIFRLAKDFGLPVVATTDAHFLTAGDHAMHEVLVCLGTGKKLAEEGRMTYDEGLYFKSAEEVASFFPNNPEVLENTLVIADQCNLALKTQYHVPAFPLPAGVATENDLLTKLATEGAEKRYGTPLPAEAAERLEYELGVIRKTGYAGYFLITADFIQAARDRDIPVGPGRGSAAGSLVAYALGITNLCPLKFDLLFERFLNPDRVSMPDVDVDFCQDRRGEVIEYVREKYGRDAVSQIATFGRMKARAAVKDAGRVLGFTPQETDQISKLIPNAPNNSLTVAEAIEKVDDVRRLYDENPRAKDLLDYAKQLEGLKRNLGIHAAGVVIAPGPLSDYVPTLTQKDKVTDEPILLTQYDMNAVEKAGMLKMDFLGLKTLTVIQDAVRMVRGRRPGMERFDIDAIGYEDAEAYKMLARGHTGGVFQFESSLAKDKLGAMQPDCFADIVAASALLRPGPLDSGMTDRFIERKRGREPITFPHPLLADALKDTQGIIVYQEQVMRAAQILAGYTLAEADMLRKAVGKKDVELIKSELTKFVERCVEKGTCQRPKAEEIANLIETFGRYGFNKSHSAAYGVISFQTAYLRAHYAPEFMAALLSSVDKKKLMRYITEARKAGVSVLPPHVNESEGEFTVVRHTKPDGTTVDAVRFGLCAIKSFGSAVAEHIVAERKANGPFTDFFDLVRRTATPALNKSGLEALIHSGACDQLGPSRAAMLAVSAQALADASASRKEQALGQISLFGEGDGGAASPAMLSFPALQELEPTLKLKKERQAIGVFASGHPLDQIADVAEKLSTGSIADLEEKENVDGMPVTFACVITEIEAAVVKSGANAGKRYAKGEIEDLSGSIRFFMSSKVYEQYQLAAIDGARVVLTGKVREDQQVGAPVPEAEPELEAGTDEGEAVGAAAAPSQKKLEIFVEEVHSIEDVMAAGPLSLEITLDDALRRNEGAVHALKALAAANVGVVPVQFRVERDGGTAVEVKKSKEGIKLTPDVLESVKSTVGAERVRVVPNIEYVNVAQRDRRDRDRRKPWGA